MIDDLIKRKDAITAFTYSPEGGRILFVDCDNFPVEFPLKDIVETLLALPPADRPKGEWVKRSSVGNWECSCCGSGVITIEQHNYCPNCGADMRGSTE